MHAHRCLWGIFVVIILYQESKAAWKFTKKTRKQALKYQSDAATYGPNVCAVQEVFSTGEKFYPDCVKKRLRKVCGHPTFVRYECCCGYGVLDGEEGCPTADPLENLRETLVRQGLKKFSNLIKNTELEYKLNDTGAFTVFAPIDEAFDMLTHDQKQRIFPWTYNALSLLHYHVSPGWHHSDHMRKLELLPTLYYGLKPVWINRASKKDMHTVNCARIIRSNILATNGVIHIIDQVLGPYDLFGNLTELLFRESNQFSEFIQVMYTSQLTQKIREGGPFTMFIPSNYAFSRLSRTLVEKIQRDKEIAEAVVYHHVAKGTYCSTAVTENTKVKMIDGASMRFQCKKNGHYIHNSKIVRRDMLAGNGIIHIVNKLQLPHSIQTLDSLARELRLTKFLDLCYEAGLLDKLETSTEMTLFIPSDRAFNDLPKETKNAIFSDPIVFEFIFDYHVTIGKFKTDSFIGDHGIKMNDGNHVKVNVHRNVLITVGEKTLYCPNRPESEMVTTTAKLTTLQGILVDEAEITSPNNECSNGILHIIDKVLIPPRKSLLDAVVDTEDLSIFRKGLEISELEDMLQSDDKVFTVFAPSDEAFQKLPEWQFDEIFKNKDKLKMVLLNHVVERAIIRRSITPGSLMQLTSKQGEKLLFRRNAHDQYNVNKYSDVLTSEITNNGVLYKIDRMIDCECTKHRGNKSEMKTSEGKQSRKSDTKEHKHHDKSKTKPS